MFDHWLVDIWVALLTDPLLWAYMLAVFVFMALGWWMVGQGGMLLGAVTFAAGYSFRGWEDGRRA